jgi:hypothetical protein
MGTFMATKRNEYSSKKVREMRKHRRDMKPKKDFVSPEQLQFRLGDLTAAGHMKIMGFKKLGIEVENITPTSDVKKYNMEFNAWIEKDFGDSPHLMGYLQSANDTDPRYRLRGWFNEDGTLRIEIVK